MKYIVVCFLFIIFGSISFYVYTQQNFSTGAPPYMAEDVEPPQNNFLNIYDTWKRPDGPAHVGLQVGHWKNDELPEELSRLHGNTGASGGGKAEWEVNLNIAEKAKALLEEKGVIVDILPATVPETYIADAFVAIHADGNTNTSVSGYKIAAPRRDYSRKASILKSYIEQTYGVQTKLSIDSNISRNMTGYYAFAFWRYDHAIHPMTTAVILETGFLTNPYDRNIIITNAQKSAQGLADGIVLYLKDQKLLAEDV